MSSEKCIAEKLNSVMAVAKKLCDECSIPSESELRFNAQMAVAYAIIEEQERCAKIAEKYDDEELEINGSTKWHGSAIADDIRKALR